MLLNRLTVLFAVEFGYLDDVELNRIGTFETALLEYANYNYADFMAELTKTGNYDDEIKNTLKTVLDQFKANVAW